MADPLTDLAMTGASTIVAAMATSTWQAARDGVVRLFRRHGGQDIDAADIEARLKSDAAVVAGDEDADGARADLAAFWKRRLTMLLKDQPEAGAELRALVDEIGALLPDRPRGAVQVNIAAYGGQVNGALGGNIIVQRASTEAPPP